MIPCDHYSTVRLGKNECLEKTTTEMIHITIILVNRPPTTFYPTDFRFMVHIMDHMTHIMNHLFGSGLKWTVSDQSEGYMGVKLDSPND